MRNTVLLMAGAATFLAAPALAQVGGAVGGTVDVAVDTGPVTSTVRDATGQVGTTVDRVDGAVNGTIDSTKLVVATREQVRAGAQIADTQGNGVGTVQSIDGDNAVIVDGGKLYTIPLAELYSRADSVTGSLVTKLPKSEIRARVQGGAATHTH